MYKTNDLYFFHLFQLLEYNKVHHDNSLAFLRHPIAKINTGFLYVGRHKKKGRPKQGLEMSFTTCILANFLCSWHLG